MVEVLGGKPCCALRPLSLPSVSWRRSCSSSRCSASSTNMPSNEPACASTWGRPPAAIPCAANPCFQYGCCSCHAIKGVRTATGGVGPPLDGIALRVIIAGGFRTRPTIWKSGSAIRSRCRQEPRCPTSRGGWGRAGHHRLPLHSREIVSADGRRATAFGASRARSIRHHSRQPPPACS